MKDCKFCKIINGERAYEEIVYENKDFIVLTDRYRKTSVGAICLIISKHHHPNILELQNEIGVTLVETINLVGNSMRKAYNCEGIRIWTAAGKNAGQSIFHFHLHLVPCKSILDRLIAMVPGLYDVLRKIIFLGNNELARQKNFELAEKIRKALAESSTD